MPDQRFSRAVIYLAMHGPEGVFGITINKPSAQTGFTELLQQLNLTAASGLAAPTVMSGGPCEAGHGFILHGEDYRGEGTLDVADGIRLTRTVDILQAIARGEGPRQKLIALGYAGWDSGQLEGELQGNGWLIVPASHRLLFEIAPAAMWDAALSQVGATPALLSSQTGRA